MLKWLADGKFKGWLEAVSFNTPTGSSYSTDANIEGDITVKGLTNASGIYSIENDITRVPFPKGGAYNHNLTGGTTPSSQGSIKIKLPDIGYTNGIGFAIDTFSFNEEKLTIFIKGRWTGSEWTNMSVAILGDVITNDKTIRFGTDSSGLPCVWVGDLGQYTNHLKVQVRDVFFQGNKVELAENWEISLVTAFDTVQVTKSNNFPYADFNKLKNISNNTLQHVTDNGNSTTKRIQANDFLAKSDDANKVEFTWYGVQSHRSTTYFRPHANNTNRLYIGNSAKGVGDWSAIDIYSNGLRYNDNDIYHTGNDTNLFFKDGSRAMTGDLDMGGQDARFYNEGWAHFYSSDNSVHLRMNASLNGHLDIFNQANTTWADIKIKSLTAVGSITSEGDIETKGNFYIPSGGAIYSRYNSNYILKDHANGNVTVNAAGGDLYLGYINTNKILLQKHLYGSGGSPLIATNTGTLHYEGQDTDLRYLGINAKATDSDKLDNLNSSQFLRSDVDDSYSGTLDATGTNWYLWSLGARGASAGEYGIGNRNDDTYRQLTFHIPNYDAYANTGNIPSFAWYSNGAVELMKLESNSGNLTLKGTATAPTFIGALQGNANTATTLQTARTINGTSFNGSANIVTSYWGSTRTLTIGNTGKSVNGSGNVSWSLSEIGAAPSSHDHEVIKIVDVRSTEDGDAYFELTPDQTPSHRVSAYFGYVSGGGSGWRGILNVKGWGTGYANWQLIGNATTATDDELYFRTGIDATWNTARKIWHEGNFDPNNKANSTHSHTWGDISGASVNSWSSLRVSTANGYIDFGPANTSYAHIYTDRPQFYMNKDILINGNKVWHAGNDGGGSGLDADMLDGISSGGFVRTDTTQTITGAKTFTSAVTIEDNELRVGDVSADSWTGIRHLQANDYDFTFQHGNASAIVNEQGGTNQAIVLGDCDTNSTTTLFGVSVKMSGVWHKRLDLSGKGDLTLTGGITASGYNNSNWDAAYGWGNHANAGYLTSLPSHDHIGQHIRGDYKSWSSVSGDDGTDGWYTLFTVTDSGNTPATCNLRAYAHSSMVFTVVDGYSNDGNITVVNYTDSGNGGYKYIKGIRLLQDGKVQVKLHGGASVSMEAQVYGSDHISLESTLVKDTSSPTISHVIEGADLQDRGLSARYITASRLYSGSGNSDEWNTAYGWGNHANAGYITSGSNANLNTLTVTGNRLGFINTAFDAEIRVNDSNPDGTGAIFEFWGDGAQYNATVISEIFQATNKMTSTNGFFQTSLKKYKKNIKPFRYSGLDLINELDIVTYDKKKKYGGDKGNIGIILDDSPKEFADKKGEHVDLYKSIFINAKATQELSEKNEKLEKENKDLKTKVESLEERLEKLEKLLLNG